MGCAGSKQRRCRHCNAPYSPIHRSYSVHVDHTPLVRDDSYHIVALKSSTLGSIKLDPSYQITNHMELDKEMLMVSGGDHHRLRCNGNGDTQKVTGGDHHMRCNGNVDTQKEFSMGLTEAKTWSEMIEERIAKVAPKTPIRTPPGEPETINTWELMEGLEDTSPFRSPNHLRSFSFNATPSPPHPPPDLPKSRFQENRGSVSPKPMWLQMENSEGSDAKNVSLDFDPEVISNFRKSLEELSPSHPFYMPPSNNPETPSVNNDDSLPTEAVESRKTANPVDHKLQPCCEEKVILYFTSLRGVRKTYEDCCHVRVILKSIGVRIDERDVSMHSGFKEELRELLGNGFYVGGLPRVFLGKKYIGGAEEVRRMHEEGLLEKQLDNCERVEDGSGGACGSTNVCEACGDIRFVPCDRCSGSCKIYYDRDYDGEEEDNDDGERDEACEDGEYGFQRCPDCNENGLIRCPMCCF